MQMQKVGISYNETGQSQDIQVVSSGGCGRTFDAPIDNDLSAQKLCMSGRLVVSLPGRSPSLAQGNIAESMDCFDEGQR